MISVSSGHRRKALHDALALPSGGTARDPAWRASRMPSPVRREAAFGPGIGIGPN